ncbi:MAG: hypothetical protein V4458_09780 [Pseudomonadota bacterium]
MLSSDRLRISRAGIVPIEIRDVTISVRRHTHRVRRSPALAGLLLLGIVLGGCASTIADAPLLGLPANTPPRPATPAEYLPVHDVPAPRQETVLDQAQQAKLEKDLLAARDRQASGAQAAQRRRN